MIQLDTMLAVKPLQDRFTNLRNCGEKVVYFSHCFFFTFF